MSEQFPKLGWGFSKAGKLLKDWPKDENGEALPGAFLTHCSCVDLQDEMLVNMLEAYGIPCLRRYPQNGSLGRVVLGMSGTGVDIFVPAEMLEDAKALISEDCEVDDDDQQ